MANQIDVKIEGVEKAIAALKKYRIVKRQACEDVLKEVGFKVEGTAKAGCPVDTGRLRASLSTNWAGSGMNHGKTGGQARPEEGVGQPGGEKNLVVVVGTNVQYAPFVEHGTKTQSAQPYLYPAYFSHEGEVEKRIGEILKKDVT